MAKILLIDDDKPFAESLRPWLAAEHHKVDVANDSAEALRFLQAFDYDILLVDWQLPDMNGVEIVKRYRSRGGQAYVMMLTGMQSTNNKVTGLESGADDYLTKPFDVQELLSRLRALLRRTSNYGGDMLVHGELTLNQRSRVVTKGGIELKLKPLEYSLLEFFMRHPKQVMAPEHLLKRVWDSDEEPSTDAVYTCINRLRKKLNDSDKEAVIKTVHGVGYRFDP